jgi:hypothetical protein
MFGKQLIIVFSLSLILVSISARADMPTFKEVQELHKKAAEKNPYSYVEKTYSGLTSDFNINQELEVKYVDKDSPASRADIRPGDIILSINGKKITNKNELLWISDSLLPGETVSGEIRRNGNIFRKDVRLEPFYMPYDFYVLYKELYDGDITMRLAIIMDEINAVGADIDQTLWMNLKKTLASGFHTVIENDFVRICHGRRNCQVVDREKMNSIINEMKFQASPIVSEDARIKIGQLAGATHLLIVSLTFVPVVQENKVIQRQHRKLVEVQSGKVLSSVFLLDEIPVKPSQKSVNQVEPHMRKEGLPKTVEKRIEPSIDTDPRFNGIKGIVLMTGEIIEGQIISMNADAVKIRTKEGKVLSYDFVKEVQNFISE